MPEGTTLEHTAAVARELALALRDLPEVTDIETYVGTSAPFNFNGLVRHYFLRSGPLVADLQVNLLPKHDRATGQPSVRQDPAPAPRADRRAPRRQRQGDGGAAGTAGALDPGGRDLRARPPRAPRPRRPGEGDLREHRGRRRRRLVRRGPRPAARFRGRPREGVARRRLAGGDRPDAAGRARRRRRGAPRRAAIAASRCRSCCASTAPSAPAPASCWR